jgi:protein-S-isoprenylcysteine O-methyltransferase Ste14
MRGNTVRDRRGAGAPHEGPGAPKTRHQETLRSGKRRSGLKALVGSGDKIGLLTLPFLIVGVVMNATVPSWFAVGGPGPGLRVLSIAVLIPGIAIWIWSVVLILMKVPHGELITSGPFRLVRHPLYAGVALLVIPWFGFLLNTWLGALIGIVVYVNSRVFAPEEEGELGRRFGPAWNAYLGSVKFPWL